MKNVVPRMNLKKSFSERVLEVVKDIPKGHVMSYKLVAQKAGNAGASRAVGSIMSHNKDKKIPCHRVVKSDGSIGGYNGIRTSTPGTNAKVNLLKREGIKFTKTNKVIF